MQTLCSVIATARAEGKAVGHFNVGNIEMFQAVLQASEETKLPVIIGVSEGERDAFGIRNIVALVDAARKKGATVFLNADHTYSVERVKEAIDAGFDAVIFDGAMLPLQENIQKTRECVEYARRSGREVVVEGELGFIGNGSQIIDALPPGAAITEDTMTTADDAKRFVSETGVDLLAPAVGNIHGMLRNAPNPNLSISRVTSVAQAAGVPLVLHGGSGISDDDFRKAILAGIAIVHISTELRVAFRDALERSLAENPGELAPYKYTRSAVAAVFAVVRDRLMLFAGRG